MTAKLILVRGLPGSGKSTFCRSVMTDMDRHLEADMYFSAGGTYKFDTKFLGAAHQWCQDQTVRALSNGITTFVSNTFTTARELRPYFEIAYDCKVGQPFVVTMGAKFDSVHNVPKETYDKMRDRFQFDISHLYTEDYGYGE